MHIRNPNLLFVNVSIYTRNTKTPFQRFFVSSLFKLIHKSEVPEVQQHAMRNNKHAGGLGLQVTSIKTLHISHKVCEPCRSASPNRLGGPAAPPSSSSDQDRSHSSTCTEVMLQTFDTSRSGRFISQAPPHNQHHRLVQQTSVRKRFGDAAFLKKGGGFYSGRLCALGGVPQLSWQVGRLTKVKMLYSMRQEKHRKTK